MEFDNHIMFYKKENKVENIRILGKYFCRNNKNKGKLIIHNKKSCLKEFIDLKNINEKQIKIIMILNKNIFNKSYMFKDCKSLLELKISDNLEYIEDSGNLYSILEENSDIYEEEMIDYNPDNIESSEFDKNTFYENCDINISEIKTYTGENNNDSIPVFLKLFELQYNFSNLKYIFYNCKSLKRFII